MDAFEAPHAYFVCTAEQCRAMDTRTIGEFGIDGFTLMEVAGHCAAEHLLYQRKRGEHGIYLCGKGNNAGDALVVARYLVQHGLNATLVFLSGIDDLSPDCRKNFELLNKVVENDERAAELSLVTSWSDFDPPDSYDFIIDGMLGTGLDSELRGDYSEAVAWAREQTVPVYAIDIPTGLHADSGNPMGTAISASETFTFGALKQGFYMNDGDQYTGRIRFCELPFPNYVKYGCKSFLLDSSWVSPHSRVPARHKYEAGVLYVVAGSEGLTGAAMLAAESAWAEGLGAVILVTPRGNLPVFEKNLPQIIKKPVGGRDDNYFKDEHKEDVLSILNEKKGTVIFGPGLGRNASTVKFAHYLFDQFRGDMIIDADGLWCLARQDDWEKPEDSDWLLTPHPGELSLLLDANIGDDVDRMKKVRAFSSEKNITVVSKGYPVMIGTPGEKIYLTGYDTRTFSRAGFGDVLAGKAGAFWALGHGPAQSAALGLLNGKEKVDKLKQQRPDRHPEPKDLV